VNAELQSVTVEWFEGGKTKGKEARTCNDYFKWRYDGCFSVENLFISGVNH